MDSLITKEEAIKIVTDIICDFFDEEPVEGKATEKDELLLKVNKAIRNNIEKVSAEGKLPKALRISDWGRKEVIYSCPICNTSFTILGNHEKHCHNCGQKINWDVPILLTRQISEDEEKEFIAKLNKELEEKE